MSSPIKVVNVTSLPATGRVGGPLYQLTSGTVGLYQCTAANTFTLVGPLSAGSPLGPTSGGTGLTSYTLGDTLYASAANTLAKLAGNITATKKFLTQTGSGAVSAAPGWNVLVSGDLPAGTATGTGTTGTIPKYTTGGSAILGDSVIVEASSNIGINGAASGTSGQHLIVIDNTDVNNIIIASNSNAAGTSALAQVRAAADAALAILTAHGTGRTATRAGVTLGGWSELAASGANGLLVGSINSNTPLRLYAGSTTGVILDGTNPHPSFPVSDMRVSSQFDKTNSTLANITGLSVTLTAGKTYRFEAILYTSSNVAGGVKFAISGTATATAIIYEAIVHSSAVLAAQTRSAALDGAVGGVTAVTVAYARITGTITVNAAGTMTVQFAQNSTNASASSVLVGSTFSVVQVQ